MKTSHRFSTVLIVVVTITALGLFAVTFRRATMAPPIEQEIVLPEKEARVGTHQEASPQRLIIPALGVDAEVQMVGIGTSGRMAVPTNYTDVGWYKYGSKPGQAGNAVFAGHLDNGLGRSGVFQQLHQLQQGDDLYIQTYNNEYLRFKVSHVETLNADLSTTHSIFSDHGPSRVMLITCEGDWNPETKTYSDRLVVTADLVARDHQAYTPGPELSE